MNRCVTPFSSSTSRRIALAALITGAFAALPASAQQVTRRFPISALRGKAVFTNPPDIEINGDAARLSPAARIHGFDNMLIVTGAVAADGNKYIVDYRFDGTGLITEIWLLTKAEAAVSPWPSTVTQATTWTFDYMAQTWTKP